MPDVTTEDRDMIKKLPAAGHIQHKCVRRLLVVASKRDAGKSVEQVVAESGISRPNVSVIINRYNKSAAIPGGVTLSEPGVG